MKIVFMPIGLVGGLVAGILGKKLFERIWGMVDDREPPQPDDHDARRGFASLTGSWPGGERPDPE